MSDAPVCKYYQYCGCSVEGIRAASHYSCVEFRQTVARLPVGDRDYYGDCAPIPVGA